MIVSKNVLMGKYILEAVVAFALILISIPIWNNLNEHDYAQIAEHYENYEAISYNEIQK